MKAKWLSVATFVATTFTVVEVCAQSQLSIEQRVRQLENQTDTRNKLQSEMNMQLIELQKEVKELRGIIEEHDYKLQQIQERQRDLYRDIENRLSQGAVTSSQSTQNQSSSSTHRNPQQQTANSQTATSVSSGNERSEFEAAFKLVRSKEYAKAVKSFESFIKKYPSGNYADNARFWIGQVYFAQGKLEPAEKQFNLLKTDYPQSSKLSSAMLKLAEIKVRQNKWKAAKAIYNEVLTNFTGAQQQLARKGLQDIKQSGH